MKKWICTVCGYVHEGEQPPEKCPQCGVPADKFKEQVEAEDRAYRCYAGIRDSSGGDRRSNRHIFRYGIRKVCQR